MNPLFRKPQGMPNASNARPNPMQGAQGLRGVGDKFQQIRNIIGMVKSGGNPQQLLQAMLAQNPQKAQEFEKLMQSGANPKQIVMDYCKQNNISPEELIKQLGLK